MSKRTIVDWSLWGLLALAVASVLGISSIAALAARHPAFAHGRAMAGLLLLAGVLATTGVIMELPTWWAAAPRTAAQGHQEWHRALLWAGITGIISTPFSGVGILIFASVLTAYLLSGPDEPGAALIDTTPSKP